MASVTEYHSLPASTTHHLHPFWFCLSAFGFQITELSYVMHLNAHIRSAPFAFVSQKPFYKLRGSRVSSVQYFVNQDWILLTFKRDPSEDGP